MTMELRDIEYFVAIADRGNVGRAADALGLSQPALSKSLRRLEASTQAKLVRKIPRGIELTAVGTALLAHVRRIRLSLHDVAHELADLTAGRAGHLRVGCGPDMVDLFVRKACKDLLEAAPKATLSVMVGINDALFPALRKGEYDLIVTGSPPGPDEHLVHEYLLDDEFVVFASARHMLVKQKRVTMADLARQQWALSTPAAFQRAVLVRAFEDHGLPPPGITLETNSHSLMLQIVASSGLLGFLPRRVVHAGGPGSRVARIRIKGVAWPRKIGVSYRKDAYLSPAAHRFIDRLRASARKITAENP